MPPPTEAIAVGDLRVVARCFDAAPPDVGGAYARIGAAAVNDAGEVAFAARLAGSAYESAIVLVANGSARGVLRSMDRAPGGGRFRTFGELDLGDDGSLFFRATLVDCRASEGIFLLSEAEVRQVARAGERSPSGHVHRSFEQLSLTSCVLPSGPYFRLACVARAPEGRGSLVVWRSYAAPTELLAAGTRVAGGVLKDLTISRLGLGLCCIAELGGRHAPRRTALLAHEGMVIWGDQLREGGRVGQERPIARILGPPAINIHTGFVALELEDGTSALATRPVGIDPEVFARTGDPAPGLADQRIVRFGAPVASSGVPRGGKFGIASAVDLSGGGRALWVGVFESQVPMRGGVIIPFCTGDSSDDERALEVDAFTPVKLSNTGVVLLRATLRGEGCCRDGLLVLDRLFEWYR